jgi:hypothetical protein
MFSRSNKTKQYLLVALKVLILVGTYYYIILKLQTTSTSVRETLQNAFTLKGQDLFYYGALFCFLIITNWLFEILKWKSLVSSMHQISFVRAAKESLAALTVSLATPNRIGEYGAKALFYPKQQRKKVLVLNLIGNSFQMLVTVIFGVIGLSYSIIFFNVSISWTTLALFGTITLLLAAMAYLFRERELLIKGFTIAKISNFYKLLEASIKIKTLLFSFSRYAVFSYMFFSLLQFFGGQLNVLDGFSVIFGMYVISSLLPSIIILDVAVKGGIAVYLFSAIGVPEIPVLCTVFSMWLLNMVLPALLGSIFLFSLKKQAS